MLRKKSLLALLLSLCMVVGILPATAFAAGQYVPENPRWSGYGNQVMWDKPANASGSTYFEYEAQLVLNDEVLQTESVEIDRWVFFDSKNITQSKDAYTLKVRARQIYLTGDPDGSYTVWKRDAWGDCAIGGNTGGGNTGGGSTGGGSTGGGSTGGGNSSGGGTSEGGNTGGGSGEENPSGGGETSTVSEIYTAAETLINEMTPEIDSLRASTEYTDESIDALLAAYNALVDLLASENPTDEDITAARTTLEEAHAALEPVSQTPDEPSGDNTEEDENLTPEEDDNNDSQKQPSGGSLLWLWIVIAIVVVLAAAAVCVYIFVFKKDFSKVKEFFGNIFGKIFKKK